MAIIHNRAQCKLCGDTIESIHRHDFKWCKCGSIFVDGGREYIRRGGQPENIINLDEFIESDVNA